MHNSTPPDLPLQRGGIFTFAVYKYVRLFIAVAIKTVTSCQLLVVGGNL
ncbi:MAG: hypothetical protein AABZ28_06045 [Nitrospinota bacterium]